MTSAGVWIAQRDSLGYLQERYSANLVDIRYLSVPQVPPTVGGVTPGSLAVANKLVKQIISIPFMTDGSGHVTVDLDTALAGYYGVVKLLYWSQHSATAHLWTLSFQDEDEADCEGANAGVINIALPIDTDDTILGFGPAGGASHHPILYTTVHEKKLQCVIAGENTTTGTLVFEEWKEA